MPTMLWPMIQVSFDREELEANLGPVKVPDLDWRYVDKAGHGHFWNKKGNGAPLPTLEWVVTSQGWFDDGTSYDIGEHRCKICAEVIEPGMKTEFPKPVFGPTVVTVTINGETFRLTEEKYQQSVEAWRDKLRELDPHRTLVFRKESASADSGRGEL
jgi:hypothetical protein